MATNIFTIPTIGSPSAVGYVNGSTYQASDLNNSIQQVAVLPAFVTSQIAGSDSSAADTFLSVQSGSVFKVTLQNIINGFPGDAAAGTKSLRSLGTGALQAAPGNDGRFSASVTGLRFSAGGGATDIAGAPANLAFASSNLAGGSNINWDSADLFYDTLSGATNKTYTFSNIRDGRVITITLDLGSYTGTITWPTLFGVTPAETNGGKMIYTFFKTGLSANPQGVSKAA
jgi:hypothetical protein